MTGDNAQSPWRIGCDVVAVASIEASIATFGRRYLDRVFTPSERLQSRDTAERLAARFAGKEAVMKLLRPHPETALPYLDIEIELLPIGAPIVTLHRRAREAASAAGLDAIEISLSHDSGTAFATAIGTLLPERNPS